MDQRWRKRHYQYLESVRDRLPNDLCSVRTHAVFSGQTVRTILDVGRAEQCDMIVMASRGRGGLSRVLLGSTAAELVGEVTMLMLTVGPAFSGVGRGNNSPVPGGQGDQ